MRHKVSPVIHFCVILHVCATENNESSFQVCNSTLYEVGGCTLFHSRLPQPQPDLNNCTVYANNSCCTNVDINLMFGGVKPMGGASPSCVLHINALMCYICSPIQNLFLRGRILHVCEEFCDDVYRNCRHAVYRGYVIKSVFKSGKEFCENRKFTVVPKGSSENFGQCFTGKLELPLVTVMSSSTSVHSNNFVLKTSLSLFERLWKYRNMLSHVLTSLLNTFDLIGILSFKTTKKFGVLPVLTVLHILLFNGANSQHSDASVNVTKLADVVSSGFRRLADTSMRDTYIQDLYDNAEYEEVFMNGSKILLDLKTLFDEFFSSRVLRVQMLQQLSVELYTNWSYSGVKHVSELSTNVLKNADFVEQWFNLSEQTRCEFDSRFGCVVCLNATSVYLAETCKFGDPRLVRDIEWSKRLEHYLKANEYPAWEYFASVEGMLRLYPAMDTLRDFMGTAQMGDARVRPWFISAISKPKDVVIIIDGSSSMAKYNRFVNAQKIASMIFSILGKQDELNVIVNYAPYWTVKREKVDLKPTILSCGGKAHLIRAQQSNIKQLKARLKVMKPEGSSYGMESILLADEMFSHSGRGHCTQILFYITDAEALDDLLIRCIHSDNQKDINTNRLKRCFTDWGRFPDNVMAIHKHRQIFPETFIIIVDPRRSLPPKLTCRRHGLSTISIDTSAGNLVRQLRAFFDFLHQPENRGSPAPIITEPYLDKLGMGLVVTIAAPVYVHNDIIGVVGSDVRLGLIESALTNNVWGTAFAFMINQHGGTVIHPAVSFDQDKAIPVGEPVFVDIVTLESYINNSQYFSNTVLRSMAKQTTGSTRMHDTFRAVMPATESVWFWTNYTRYHYSYIKDSDFSFAYSLAESDENFKFPKQPPRGPSTPRNIVSKTPEELDGVSVIDHNHSTVHLAPRAFCSPTSYLRENKPTREEIESYLNNDKKDVWTSVTLNCTVNPYQRSVKSDVMITGKLEPLWKNMSSTIRSYVERVYVGTASGVLRQYPGFHGTAKKYDHTRRPWYLQAQISKHEDLAVSSVYKDMEGAGIILTLSKVIFRGRNAETVDCVNTPGPSGTGCSCSKHIHCASRSCVKGRCVSYVVHGVIAVDLLYLKMEERLYELSKKAGVPCQEQCFIVNNLGHMVRDHSFLSIGNGANSDLLYTKKSLATTHGYVFGKLLQMKVFESHRKVNYQDRCAFNQRCPLDLQERVKSSLDDQPGPIPNVPLAYACVTERRGYVVNRTLLEQLGVVKGNLTGDPCGSGTFYFTYVPNTNLYILLIENYEPAPEPFNVNCLIYQRIHNPGSFEVPLEDCAGRRRHNHMAYPGACHRNKTINATLTCSAPDIQTHVMFFLVLNFCFWS